jgi:hypothetical protein
MLPLPAARIASVNSRSASARLLKIDGVVRGMLADSPPACVLLPPTPGTRLHVRLRSGEVKRHLPGSHCFLGSFTD